MGIEMIPTSELEVAVQRLSQTARAEGEADATKHVIAWLRELAAESTRKHEEEIREGNPTCRDLHQSQAEAYRKAADTIEATVTGDKSLFSCMCEQARIVAAREERESTVRWLLAQSKKSDAHSCDAGDRRDSHTADYHDAQSSAYALAAHAIGAGKHEVKT